MFWLCQFDRLDGMGQNRLIVASLVMSIPSAPMTQIFMHIPKTGGTTVCDYLRRIVPKRERFDHIRVPHPHRDEPVVFQFDSAGKTCVLGHYFYGIHEHFDAPHQYFTMLRDPVERILSLYSFHRSMDLQPWVRDASLAEFMERHKPSSNFQVAQVCGRSPTRDVETAKARLDSFMAVGVTESFGESLELFRQSFGWPVLRIKYRNKTKERLRREDITADEVRMIEAANEQDAELHEYATYLLRRRVG